MAQNTRPGRYITVGPNDTHLEIGTTHFVGRNLDAIMTASRELNSQSSGNSSGTIGGNVTTTAPAAAARPVGRPKTKISAAGRQRMREGAARARAALAAKRKKNLKTMSAGG